MLEQLLARVAREDIREAVEDIALRPRQNGPQAVAGDQRVDRVARVMYSLTAKVLSLARVTFWSVSSVARLPMSLEPSVRTMNSDSET